MWSCECFFFSSPRSEKREEISQKRDELESLGRQLPPPKSKDSHFDSNCITPGTHFMARLAACFQYCITPGTHFMARLAVCLQYYIHDRLNNSPAWQGIKVRYLLGLVTPESGGNGIFWGRGGRGGNVNNYCFQKKKLRFWNQFFGTNFSVCL